MSFRDDLKKGKKLAKFDYRNRELTRENKKLKIQNASYRGKIANLSRQLDRFKENQSQVFLDTQNVMQTQVKN